MGVRSLALTLVVFSVLVSGPRVVTSSATPSCAASNESILLVNHVPFNIACTVDPSHDQVFHFSYDASKYIPRVTTTAVSGIPANQTLGVLASQPCGSLAWDVPLLFEEAPSCS